MQYTWNDIKQHVSACTLCPLSQTRHLPVMGRGDHQAGLMLIAEAPGNQEDQQGLPFVGRSGEILDKLLQDCGLTREEIYITNIVKCHPPSNRDPKEEEKKDIFELLHCRRKRSSTIFCSQYQRDGWYEQLGGDASPLADAILDRIVHDAYMIDIIPVDPSKDISMREVYGLKESDCM